MKQVLLRKGQAVLADVPMPQVSAGCVLVQLEYSAISTGTEVSSLQTTAQPLWQRALQQPEQVKKIIDMIIASGVKRTHSLVKAKLAAGSATGYSCAGTVIAIGDGIQDLQVGMKVACAGAQFAHHAQFVNVPRQLVVPIPQQLCVRDASTVTIGAIALQGVRRAQPTLGEYFVVVGLGILGQLTAQFLKANGCHVIGIDLDARKLEIALAQQSIDLALTSLEADKETIYRLTRGVGVDGVIITAASSSNDIVNQSFQLCRKKGRVVIVGDVGLKLRRADFYAKEIDVLISCSYGPGRYDENYEQKGQDYPIGYVRWTENRNMEAYLSMLATKKVKIEPLIENIYPLENAAQAYEDLQSATTKPLLVLLEYPQLEQVSECGIQLNKTIPKAGRLNVALIGAGGFAKGVHLPHLEKLAKQFHLRAVVSNSGHNAMATAQLYQANYATTQFEEVLNDGKVDALIITTRHHLHAEMTLQALNAGKHVLVEKPLVLTSDELNQIKQYFTQNQKTPLLLTGFNRRFSPHIQHLKNIIAHRQAPLQINYVMNAGFISPEHWVHGEEGGGRNLGEACHIYDLLTYLCDAKIQSLYAQSIKPLSGVYGKTDNFSVLMSFEDGSTANFTYTAMGHKKYSKELMQVFCENQVLVLDDYQRLDVFGGQAKGMKTSLQEKGQLQELVAFGHAISHLGEWPIPLWQQIQATQMALDVEKMITQ